MLPTLIGSWRDAWSVVPGSTAADAGFGIVMLADSTDEGWGCNVPQMHGNVDIIFGPFELSRPFLSSTSPRTRRVRCTTWCPLLTQGADWCSEFDVVADLGLQALGPNGKRGLCSEPVLAEHVPCCSARLARPLG